MLARYCPVGLDSQKSKTTPIPTLGFPLPVQPTSMTIGINPPEVVKERIPLLLDGSRFKSLKIKLGSRKGSKPTKQCLNKWWKVAATMM